MAPMPMCEGIRAVLQWRYFLIHQLPARKGTVVPGLLRGVARTAVVAGIATAVSNRS
jgi:hypothetical protein